MYNGILPLNKPAGMTSNDCVIKARRLFHQRKIGHSGTLDPQVTGVLPLCLGHGTKVVNYLMESGKVYRGQIILGMATTTEDLEGDVVAHRKLDRPFADEQISAAMEEFVGTITQIPPLYSAVKVNGKRLYEYARNNEPVVRPKRQVEIKDFKLLQPSRFDEANHQQVLSFEVACGKGTYVRTLAVDLGKKLGVPAVMSKLIRVYAGGFNLTEAVTFAQLEQLAASDQLSQALHPVSQALTAFPKVNLTDKQWRIVKNGGFLNPDYLATAADQIALFYRGKARCVYALNAAKGRYQPEQMIDLTD